MFDVQKRRLFAASAVLCTFLSGVMARAERADRDQPIYVQADRWTHDDLKQISTLSGRVVVTQGTTVLKGDRVVIREVPPGYYFLNSTARHGTRAYFRSKRDRVDESIEGEGERIDYDGKNEIATLSGHAVVRRVTGSATVIDEIHGNVIRYDSKNNLYTAESSTNASGKPTGRVRAILSPRTGAASFKEGAPAPLEMSDTLNKKTKP